MQVWVCLALEFVARQLEKNEARSTDVFSLVSMSTEDSVLISRKPMDWLLFNEIVGLLRSLKPAGDGNYLPALDAAERLLMSNTSGSCALMLCFLSDGRPSDKPQRSLGVQPQSVMTKLALKCADRVEALASRFGRRLSMAMIGFASSGDEFVVSHCFLSAILQYLRCPDALPPPPPPIQR